jgi:hypothetical protein
MALNTFAFLKKEKKDFGGEFEQAEMALIETKFFLKHTEEMANENSAWFFLGVLYAGQT